MQQPKRRKKVKTIRKSMFIPLLAGLVLFAGGCERPAVTPATTAAVTSTDGVEIRYDVAGKGETALVFVHCWTCNRRFWDESSAHFGKSYQVVRLDLAGHGESGTGRKDYTMAAFGGDVAAVVDKLALKRVILIGHSMGGPVSAEAEKRLGARVIGVVGVDTFHNGFPLPKNDKEVADFVKPFEDDFKGHGDKFMRSMFTPKSDPALIDRIGGMVLGANQDMAVNALRNILVWCQKDAAASFARLGDRLRNINADPKGENKPLDKSVTLIAGVGHFVAQEKPAEFNLALENIVKGFESIATNK
jgi:pimeloyl-ACP methyl ester carboxylesterase